MKCKQAYHHICDSLGQDLESPRCREIRKHLEACPDCSAYLDSLKKTVLLYREASSRKVPPPAHKKLFRAIDIAWAETASTKKKQSNHNISDERRKQ